jgi:hypothetical protein
MDAGDSPELPELKSLQRLGEWRSVVRDATAASSVAERPGGPAERVLRPPELAVEDSCVNDVRLM